MGIRDRYKYAKDAEANRGKPLGGGLDAMAPPSRGTGSLDGVSVNKPVERGGKAGLEVRFTAHLVDLGGAKVILETTLHEQGKGPLKSRLATFADGIGNLQHWELFTPADDDPLRHDAVVFIPFEAIDVDREGRIKCFARVRLLESNRGTLAEDEAAFEVVTG